MTRDSELFSALFDHLERAMRIACDLGLKHLCYLLNLAIAESTDHEVTASRRERRS